MVLFLLGCSKTTVPSSPMAPPAADLLWVSAYTSGVVLQIDPATGEIVGEIAGVDGAQAIRFGPDGAVYLVAEERGQVLRYDGSSIEVFLDAPLVTPTGLAFGEDGAWFVGDFREDVVHRFHPDGTWDRAVGTGLDGPDAGLVLGSDGWLWVPCFEADALIRLDPVDGTTATWIPDVASPRVVQEHDGRVWLTSWRGDSIRTTTPGAQTSDAFAAVDRPSGLLVQDDAVWVTSDQEAIVRRLDLDGETVQRIRLVERGVEGLTFLAWGPDPGGS